MTSWKKGAMIALGGPMGLWIARLQPAWPEGSGLLHAAAAVTLCAICLTVFRGPGSGKRRNLAAGLAIISLAAYLTLTVCFVVEIDPGDVRTKVVKGFQLKTESNQKFTNKELFKLYGADPESIWTPTSLNVVRMGLIGAFHVMLAAATVAFASQDVRPASRQRQPNPMAKPKVPSPDP